MSHTDARENPTLEPQETVNFGADTVNYIYAPTMVTVHRASDRVEYEAWITRLEEAAAELELSDESVTTATDLFLSEIPEDDRTKPTVAAASLYAGALIAGESRSQASVAEAVGVSRLSVQQRWKPIVEAAGFQPPKW